jgi:hypothetical protein
MQPEQHRDRDDVDGHTFGYQVRDGSTECSKQRWIREGRRVRMTDRRRMLSADSDPTSVRRLHLAGWCMCYVGINCESEEGSGQQ